MVTIFRDPNVVLWWCCCGGGGSGGGGDGGVSGVGGVLVMVLSLL